MAEQQDMQQQLQVAEALQQQLGQLEQQRGQLQNYIQDIEEAQEAIAQIGEQEPGETVLLPIGSGAFVHATLSETDTVLAPLGSGLLAEEAPEKATERLDSRKNEAVKARDQVDANMERLEQQLEQIVQQLRGARGGGQPGPRPQE